MAAAPPAEQQQGVLLYYKYVDLYADQTTLRDVAAFYEQLCGRLQQKGRVRVARDGVNVTVGPEPAMIADRGAGRRLRPTRRRPRIPQVGGSIASLEAHVDAVKAHPVLRGSDIDFKLAPSSGPVSSGAQEESGFTRLAVNLCQVRARGRAGGRAAHTSPRYPAPAGGPAPIPPAPPPPATPAHPHARRSWSRSARARATAPTPLPVPRPT
jgi:hypothetical protein